MRVCKADHSGVCICSELTVRAQLSSQTRGSALLSLGPIHMGVGFCFNERMGYRCAAKISNANKRINHNGEKQKSQECLSWSLVHEARATASLKPARRNYLKDQNVFLNGSNR